MEQFLGGDFYFVHFNRQPGVADAVFAEDTSRFLCNLYRTDEPRPGVSLIDLAGAPEPHGDPVMSDDDLAVYISAFETSGFTGGINWYRNLDRNWRLLADVDPIVRHPTLMIHGDRDAIARSANLAAFVPDVEVRSLDAGHWIQEERPAELNEVIVEWLTRQDAP